MFVAKTRDFYDQVTSLTFDIQHNTQVKSCRTSINHF